MKCDLGPVDNPHPPPCARCLRERAQCVFANTRKKDKRGSEEGDDEPVSHKKRKVEEEDNYHDSKILPVDGQYPIGYNGSPHGNIDPTLRVRSPHSHSVLQPLRSPPRTDPRLNPRLAPAMTPGPHSIQPRGIKSEQQLRSEGAESTWNDFQSRTTQDNLLAMLRAAQSIDGVPPDPKKMKEYQRSAAGGPDVSSDLPLTPEQRLERERALSIWRAVKYVRTGWFTAEEALRYVEYFYSHLHPMTPVDVSDFQSPRSHLALITEEPVLTITILTIASRYLEVSGRSYKTRSHKIHEHLWASLMETIQRLFWGQEQFGGGFTGAGVSRVRESASGQITWPGSLRTLGTVEALLLLSDWQPRSLHFPPGSDDNHLLNVNYDKLPTANGSNGQATPMDSLPYASWLEPAWRSDKMCWMLMSIALGLSFELGLFDTSDVDGPSTLSPVEQQRKSRIRRMVLVYVAQISGRNGFACPLRLSEWERSFHNTSATPVDQMQSLWVHIASIMNRANREIFPSRQFTRKLVSSTQYRESIATFAPLLTKWKQHFDEVKVVLQDPMLSILEMEYEYARLYINSLGLQNVVESWMRTGPQAHSSMSSVSKVVSENKHYIQEVTKASVHILEIVSEILGTHHYLRNGPVRVFLRALSAMMFILKVSRQ